MSFNTKKCKVMHVGGKNPKFKYQMNGVELATTEEEKDIGVNISSNLKPTAHCNKAARTAQVVSYQNARAFHYRDRHFFVRLYVHVQYVRPHLEFAVAAWSPWTLETLETLEKVQKWAVKVSGLRSQS